MSLYQTVVETLLDKRGGPQDCNNMRLVLDKLKSLLNTYEKTKWDFVGVIQRRVHQSKLCLLEKKNNSIRNMVYTSKEIWHQLSLKIGVMTNVINCKSFDNFKIVNNDCQPFEETYNKMIRRLINNNGRYN